MIIKDVSTALKVSDGIRAGTVWVNTYGHVAPNGTLLSRWQVYSHSLAPFGGFKSSGIGREYGEYGLQAFTEVKSVYIKYDK